jgi:hypothetical protein
MAPGFLWWGGAAVGYSFYVGPRWVYCPRGDVFSPVVGSRVVTGAAAAPIAARVRTYTPATPGVAAGPPPQKLGYAMAQVPHATGAAATNVARAQQFARPSTAQALGAHAPVRFAVPSTSAGVAARGYSTGGLTPAPGHATLPAPAARPPVSSNRRPAVGTAPAPHPAPSFHGGAPHTSSGGHHR